MLYRIYYIIFLRYFYWAFYKCKVPHVRSFVKNSRIGYRCEINSGSVIQNSELGAYSYLNNAKVFNAVIGRYCSVGFNSLVGPGSHDLRSISTHPLFEDELTRQSYQDDTRVWVGNDVWIGANAIILDGKRIANGSVIAAGAVVTKNTEPFGIYAGVPARLIGYRYSEINRKKIAESCWWNHDYEYAAMIIDSLNRGVLENENS
jgi:acetyltransferase-like isoleucine patch superfamily enzyme